MKKIFKVSVIGLSILLLSACATTSNDPSQAFKNQTPQQIYHDGKKLLENGGYSESIKRFEALDVQYPFWEGTESADLYLIYAYYMKEDYALAVSTADRFIQMHPTNPHIDYAYYMRGVSDCYENLGFVERIFTIDLAKRDLVQLEKAYDDFDEVITRFPQSYYAASAHQYMIYVRDVLADHERHVAEYYYSRHAYVAAADRASGLVAHYQGAPTVIDGLILMAKSYHQLGLTKLEQDTMEVFRYNYPNLDLNYQSPDLS
jgi:outer membrane protein assembly factor BamD